MQLDLPHAGDGHELSLQDLRSIPTQVVESSDGVTLAVHDLGGVAPMADPGPSRPILFAHATGFHGLVWAPVARHLGGFHGWAPDLRGHGHSPPPVGLRMDWAAFADDIVAVVDALRDRGLVRGALVAAGHSKGGTALLMAEQRRPGTFAAIFCYEPVVFPDDFVGDGDPGPAARPNPMAEAARRRRGSFDSRRAAYDNYASKPPFEGLAPEALMAYVDHGFVDREGGGVELACRPEVEALVYEAAWNNQAFAHLGEIACPVTIATGREGGGAPAPAAIAGRVADELPDGRLVRFPDLGHFGPLEQPEAIAEAIAESVTPRT